MADTVYPAAVDSFGAMIAAEVQPTEEVKSQHMRSALAAAQAIEGALGVAPQGGNATVAARLDAIDTTMGTKVDVAGDRMTGPLIIGTGTIDETGGAILAALIIGSGNTVAAQNAVAEGGATKASGVCAHSEGAGTTASGGYSHAEGTGTTASGGSSHAGGAGTTASGAQSHAEGGGTTASGEASHAEGVSTIALGASSHAEGVQANANGAGSHAEGYTTVAGGDYAHSEGSTTEASGEAAHSEGYNTKATGGYSHAEGLSSLATETAAHAEGASNTASGNSSHAEGSSCLASGPSSHAEGTGTVASGDYSHAGGKSSSATGNQSRAEGQLCISGGANAYAGGYLSLAVGATDFAHGTKAETANVAGLGGNLVLTDSQNTRTKNDLDQQHKERFANGVKIVEGGRLDYHDGSNIWIKPDSLHTTDAVEVYLATYPTFPTNGLVLIRTRIMAKYTGTTGFLIDVTDTWINIDNGVEVAKSIQQVSHASAGYASAWTNTIKSVSGLNYALAVTGGTGELIDWYAISEIQIMDSSNLPF
jgi:hypothetical protein